LCSNLQRIDDDDSEPEFDSFDSIVEYVRFLYGEEVAQFGVEALLWPGRSSDSGFLGRNERLADVSAADSTVLEGLGVSHGALADKLDHVLGAAMKELDRDPFAELFVDERYWVEFAFYFGSQYCPFEVIGECVEALPFNAVDWTITSTSGAQVSGPGMLSHLIRCHRFFEGRSVPYRVDPLELARLLDLT
jgi:hypothetical protein